MRRTMGNYHQHDRSGMIRIRKRSTTTAATTERLSMMMILWVFTIISVSILLTSVPVDAFSTQPSTPLSRKTPQGNNNIINNNSKESTATPSTRQSSSLSSRTLFEKHRQAREWTNENNDSVGTPSGGSLILTYLEINGWLLTTTTSENDDNDGSSNTALTILIDPILEGPLDFGLPGELYVGTKVTLPPYGLTESIIRPLSPIDCLVLTQGLDDHAHVRTLKRIRFLDPAIPIIAPLSAKNALARAGFDVDTNIGSSSSSSRQVRFIEHGQEFVIHQRLDPGDGRTKGNSVAVGAAAAKIRATKGALVGPPWQKRENGYIISPITAATTNNSDDKNKNNKKKKSFPSMYIEPHVEFNQQELVQIGRKISSSSGDDSGSVVDVVISPITGQTLPAFELVHGPDDTIRLLQLLRPKYLIPMRNGNIQMKGPVAALVSEVGSDIDFKNRLQQSMKSSSSSGGNNDIQIVEAPPGEDIVITVQS